MMRTATVLALTAALLAPVPALAQASPTPTGGMAAESPAPSPTPSSCSTGGSLVISPPTPRSVIAGDVVTLIVSARGEYDNAYARIEGYRWASPTQRGGVEFTANPSQQMGDVIEPLAAGETATRTVTLRPTSNTRVVTRWGYRAGCLYADGGSQPHQEVINVAPRITIKAVRNGVRDYTFFGEASRAGQILSLYRVTATGSHVLTAQTRATDARAWSLRRVFLGSGRFGFVVRTGRDMMSAPGASRVRDTVIH